MIDRVLLITEMEDEAGLDHFLSHWCLCKKVLREDAATSILFANTFSHHRLTREKCEGMLKDWQDEGWI